MAYVETAGGVRVAEDDPVAVGKNDVSSLLSVMILMPFFNQELIKT